MMCPHCKSIKTVKMGCYHTKSGERRQRYKCKNCGRTFVLNPIKPRNYPEEFKEMVVKAVVREGVGVRQASRIFKLSPNTVTAWVREFSKKRPEK
ncbi:Insertion element protein [Ferroglobus placidus DSM 10642]|uniref:Insertion element protein n=1 Tax=Ferroglobus placidus (strain DSM 10642 / AEDII12DO) TaxID=589924 RepID=D3S1V8_FERPA|nr:transposase [Ferroglobus placidus]ADC64415.1 Insertion element protein [Ferroglobus placidus DSM 10642]